MKAISLRLRTGTTESIDISSLRLEDLVERTPDQISHLVIRVDSLSVQLGEIFELESQTTGDSHPTLVLKGDCRRVHHLGHQHRVGRIMVEADIGDHCGACMSGGSIRIAGNAGRYLAAPTGSRKGGMDGGQIVVGGSAGDFAGSRMRRGEIWIAGDAGAKVAAWQVAGTIGVGGVVGNHVGYGMRRGTLILAAATRLPEFRFTTPIELATPFLALRLHNSALRSIWPPARPETGLTQWFTSRGDRSIGGIGEVWHPLPPPN
ncbi:formylmethanofuran dehydrogenase subunit C [Allorhodopirellula solitaria]|uniref:Formyltransferase/hydrolase complex Fhc subunit C n=1 Tax=Allorhodopirellula solitaria TaxID=2527987 RepID=A0A5C5XN22_9BACT|nr:formylmethanofuran dehydrogenase subunit C [Allorhodopirellula solitaria]TWT64586.1 Formyltransferase/hydrolase complex Fhc subunit C [Allorhodopirellula solitaria]